MGGSPPDRLTSRIGTRVRGPSTWTLREFGNAPARSAGADDDCGWDDIPTLLEAATIDRLATGGWRPDPDGPSRRFIGFTRDHEVRRRDSPRAIDGRSRKIRATAAVSLKREERWRTRTGRPAAALPPPVSTGSGSKGYAVPGSRRGPALSIPAGYPWRLSRTIAWRAACDVAPPTGSQAWLSPWVRGSRDYLPCSLRKASAIAVCGGRLPPSRSCETAGAGGRRLVTGAAFALSCPRAGAGSDVWLPATRS